MRILISNDDSINAPALKKLATWAKKYGQVTVVAPKVEQSGKSHGIEIIKSMEIKKVDLVDGVEAYYVDSTPADCVRYGIIGLKREYDLVISGINRGYNLGKDIVYSGTVGAVYESVGLGFKSVAISTAPHSLDLAIESLDRIFNFFKDNNLFAKNDIYNVNIPECEHKGIRITRTCGGYYSDEFDCVGDCLYLQVGKMIWDDKNDLNLDTDAVMHGYISITPLSCERTQLSVWESLKDLNR
ncbi:MAG: 5'/3'-nucleotidase SurE [Clostridia bacterium]|nr:5'/3'-nucleotidase SurE [Clostridia bacterium]